MAPMPAFIPVDWMGPVAVVAPFSRSPRPAGSQGSFRHGEGWEMR